MADTVTLAVDGVRHEGWTSIDVALSIETIAGSFELGVTERWPGQPTRRPIRRGAACTVAVGGETVITGHVDEHQPSYGAAEQRVTVTGRDATGDLVDCAAVHKPGEWTGLTLDAIARILCQPFGIAVATDADVGKPFAKFALQPGETVFEALDRACRARAVLPVSDGRGGLVFTRAGAARRQTALVLGENVLEASATFSATERFATYIVRGQQAGDDNWGPTAAAEPEGRATDPAIGRYRPTIIIAETPEGQSFADRARWEASVRSGRSDRAEYTVLGWRDGAGALWRPNALVDIDDARLGINRTMLVSSVLWRLDDQGRRTVLSLVKPEAFQLIALKDTEEDGQWTSPPSAG